MAQNVSVGAFLQDLDFSNPGSLRNPELPFLSHPHDSAKSSSLTFSDGHLDSRLGLGKFPKEENTLFTWLLKTWLPWLCMDAIKKIFKMCLLLDFIKNS